MTGFDLSSFPDPIDTSAINFGPGITVVIPSIPPRRYQHLHRALDSVLRQELPAEAVVIEFDTTHAGAAVTRNRGLEKVTTEWTAFLDDDDEFLPDHLALLVRHARMTDADMVYPWFTVPEGWDPFPDREGQPFDPVLLETRNTIPITVLIKTELIQRVGGFEDRNTSTEPGASPCEDWNAWIKVRDAGAKIEHLNRRTWLWHWSSGPGGNTSGRGDRW